MCGIVAMISSGKFGFVNNDIERFNQLLVCDSVRGPDSTGVFGVNNKGNVEYLKEKGNPFKLIETDEYKDFMRSALKGMQFLVGHNRKATVGNISDETAHPFQEENIILVHNGTLTNHKDLTNADVDVDSHAICHAFVEKGYKEALKEIQGAFTLVWYDINDKTLRFVRNDKRPLNIFQYENKTVLSSEARLGKWIIERDRYHDVKVTHTEVKPGIVYSISIDNAAKINQEPIDFYKEPVKEVVVEVKKPQPNQGGGTIYLGWEGYECKVGDRIVINITERMRFKSSTKASGGYLKGTRIFKDQPIVFCLLNDAELSALEETDEDVITVEVTGIRRKDGVSIIYANRPDSYVPYHDVTGEEVFEEEWDLVDNHKCRKCGTIAQWKDVTLTRFKFKSPTHHRIVCKECIK